MAKIVITTWGSAGDLNPYLALGIGLKARGHDVLFAVDESFREPLEAHGFARHILTGDAEASFVPHARQMFTSGMPMMSIRLVFSEYVIPTLRTRIEELHAACEGADLLVSSGPQVAASFVAELTGIRWASMVLTPLSVPSPYLDALPHPPLPEPVRLRLNDVLWKWPLTLLNRDIDPPINAIRAEYGLTARHGFVSTANLSATLALVATSPAFCTPPPDWPVSMRMTGFCYYDGADTWQEPPELTAFLATDAPVVAVSSGSMSAGVLGYFDAFYRTSIAAIRRAGARALVIGAPSHILPEPLPADVLAIPFAPFSRVYPRCAAVIHHGGIGTTAQALRAGVPALVVPWGVDQFGTALQVARIGAGRWMTRRAYRTRRVAKMLRALLHEQKYRVRAREIAAQIAREDGVAAACDALEAILPGAARSALVPATVGDIAGR